MSKQSLICIDSHTGGEPTRIVTEALPDLGSGSVKERLEVLRQAHDWVRTATVLEPRGSDVMVGGVLLEPSDPTCQVGVIFFNNAGYLGMCGHGTIGLVETLTYLGRFNSGTIRIETPVGVVAATRLADGRVQIRNVPSYRFAQDVSLNVPGYGEIVGDVAYGGNWFFLVHWDQFPVEFNKLEELADASIAIRRALEAEGITGDAGALIDHVELFGPSEVADSRNYVLCPGLAYDRSPCGTGTSAKLACLYENGDLAPGETWRQESIVGSIFEGSVELDGADVIPSIIGRAFVTGELKVVVDDEDPFRWGIVHE